MKRIIVLLVIGIAGIGLSSWQHATVQAKYHNFKVTEQQVGAHSFPVQLAPGIILHAVSLSRTDQEINHQLTLVVGKNAAQLKTTDFAIAFKENEADQRLSDFDPSETKVDGQTTENLTAGRHTLTLATMNNPDSKTLQLYYLGREGSKYTQLTFEN